MREAIETSLKQAVKKGEFSGDPRAMALKIITVFMYMENTIIRKKIVMQSSKIFWE